MHKLTQLLLAILCGTHLTANGQRLSVHGKLVDSAHRPQSAQPIMMVADTDTSYAISNESGEFMFERPHVITFRLVINRYGALVFSKSYEVLTDSAQSLAIPDIVLPQAAVTLNEIVVKGDPIVIKEDTIQYNVRDISVREGAVVEDVIRKLPGITVDRNGNLMIQGTRITKLRLNGKDFLDGDVQTATQNLPADILANIQIIDDYGYTGGSAGMKSADPEKVININTSKKKSKGSFGNLTAGMSDGNRYLSRVLWNAVTPRSQISLLASFNNTPSSAADINRSSVSVSDGSQLAKGPATSKSIGLTYKWEDNRKLALYGSVMLSQNTTVNEFGKLEQDFSSGSLRLSRQDGTSTNYDERHQVIFNIEYRPNIRDLIKLSSRLSIGHAENTVSGASSVRQRNLLTENVNQFTGDSRTPAEETSIYYCHAFKKPGRELVGRVSYDYSTGRLFQSFRNAITDKDSIIIDSTQGAGGRSTRYQSQHSGSNSSSLRASAEVLYSEPITAKLIAAISYSSSVYQNAEARSVSDIDSVTGLKMPLQTFSSFYRLRFASGVSKITIRHSGARMNYALGLALHQVDLAGFTESANMRTDYKAFNWNPNARVFYKFSKTSSLTISYTGLSSPPDFRQTQPNADSTNPTAIIIGNPDLKPQFSHTVNTSVTMFRSRTDEMLTANLTFNRTLNKISPYALTSTTTATRTITYINAPGYYTINANASFSKPFLAKKYLATANVRGRFDRGVSYTNALPYPSYNWLLNPGVQFQATLSDIADVAVMCSYILNRLSIVSAASITSSTASFVGEVNGKVYVRKRYTFGYDFTKVINATNGGYGIPNPSIVNLYAELRFLKEQKGSIRLQGFDLFDQNAGVVRVVDGGVITDFYNKASSRYFLLSFAYLFSRFSRDHM